MTRHGDILKNMISTTIKKELKSFKLNKNCKSKSSINYLNTVVKVYRGTNFLSLALPGLYKYRSEQKKQNPDFNKLHNHYAPKALHKIQKLKGIYYKLGQAFGCRGDIVPDVYHQHFVTLLDNIPPLKFKIVKKKLKQQMKMLDSIEKKSISCASIGQVHKASYKNNKIVLKVLHPDIETKTKADLDIVNMWMKHAMPWLSTIMDEFINTTLLEFDFRREAFNHKIIKNGINLDNVYIPYIVDELVSKDVLGMEYIEATSLTKYMKELYRLEQRQLIERIFIVTIVEMFEIGLFSSDPHPGNFLVNNNLLIPLDFGQVSSLNSDDRSMLKDLMFSIALSNSTDTINCMKKMGFISSKNNKEFFNVFSIIMFDTINENNEGVAELDEFYKIDKWLTVPQNYGMVIKCILTLRGLCSLYNFTDLSFAKVCYEYYNTS
jgi:ubiquinone biosynthesis protein